MAKVTAIKPKATKEVLVVGATNDTPVNTEEEEVKNTSELEPKTENEELEDDSKDSEGEADTEASDTPEDTTVVEDTAQTEVSKSESEAETKAPEVKFVEPEKEKVVPDQNVKIRVGRNYSCFIGGVRYSFDKDKVYTVPKNVRSVLSEEENLLKPL